MQQETKVRRSVVLGAVTALVAPLAAVVSFTLAATPAQAGSTTFDSPAAMTIPSVPQRWSDGEQSVPVGTIRVSGLDAVTTDVNVTIRGFRSTDTSRNKFLLVGPHGEGVTLLADAVRRPMPDGSTPCTAAAGSFDLTFDDSAASEVAFPLESGTFKPSSRGGACTYRNPLAVSYKRGLGEGMATFNGVDPNGTWRLYAASSSPRYVGETGSIDGGWSLDIDAAPLQAEGDAQIQGPQNSAFHHGITCAVAGDGGAVKFPVKIINTGSKASRFRLLAPAPAKLYASSFSNTPLVQPGLGYLTDPIPAGATKTLYAKIALDVSPDRTPKWSEIRLGDVNGGRLDGVSACVQEAAGGTAPDAAMLIKAGAQKPTSGNDWPVLTGKTLVPGSAVATYTVTLKNLAKTKQSLPLSLEDLTYGWHTCDNIRMTVKDGRTDVTGQVMGGTYETPPLLPGTSRNITITATATAPYVGADDTCDYVVWTVMGMGYADLYLNLAASATTRSHP